MNLTERSFLDIVFGDETELNSVLNEIVHLAVKRK